jgi:hypothetical protein
MLQNSKILLAAIYNIPVAILLLWGITGYYNWWLLFEDVYLLPGHLIFMFAYTFLLALGLLIVNLFQKKGGGAKSKLFFISGFFINAFVAWLIFYFYLSIHSNDTAFWNAWEHHRFHFKYHFLYYLLLITLANLIGDRVFIKRYEKRNGHLNN